MMDEYRGGEGDMWFRVGFREKHARPLYYFFFSELDGIGRNGSLTRHGVSCSPTEPGRGMGIGEKRLSAPRLLI